MRLTLIDKIVELKPGESIRATKSLTMNEDYLDDHFPRFPVMPGVLMLESMYQAAAWLVRATDEFKHSMVLLSETKNVKFSDFVTPGQTLWVTVEYVKQTDRFVTLKCQGEINGNVAVKGRMVVERYNLADSNASDSIIDAHVLTFLRDQFQLLYTLSNSETNNN